MELEAVRWLGSDHPGRRRHELGVRFFPRTIREPQLRKNRWIKSRGAPNVRLGRAQREPARTVSVLGQTYRVVSVRRPAGRPASIGGRARPGPAPRDSGGRELGGRRNSQRTHVPDHLRIQSFRTYVRDGPGSERMDPSC